MKRFLLPVLCLALAASCAQNTKAPESQDTIQKYDQPDSMALVTISAANLREKPDYAAEMGTQALMGTPVKVLQFPEGDYWVQVQTPDGYKAWVNEMALKQMTVEEYSAWKASDRVIVTAYFTFFYETPDVKSAHVSDAVMGDIVESLGVEDGFNKVRIPDGRIAYVPVADVADLAEWVAARPADGETDLQRVMETAKAMTGVPYLWGGSSLKGVDCSGLTQYVYFLSGYMLPRNASAQCKAGEPVDVSQGLGNLQAGDLVFFASKTGRISHVALYLGEGRIIQSSQLVRTSSLVEGDPDFYPRKVVQACRIIGTQDKGLNIRSILASEVYF